MTEPTRSQIGILFTAFEPSGDAHAAPVIRLLREKAPHLSIYAWGGPRMEEAGATLLGRTADDGAMGLAALGKVRAVRREVRRIREWSRNYRVLLHVAVDSPAANFPICKFMRASGARVVHLVAPQLWAWGRWRTRKLRRSTDLVLCLLPFEEDWFGRRDIPAKFVGHPRMNRPIDLDDLRSRMHGLPSGSPRIALFPGSRTQEVKKNIRLLVAAFHEIQARHNGACGVIAAANARLAEIVRKKVRVFPTGLHLVAQDSDVVAAWADLALTVSGTMSMDLTRIGTPMVGVYRTSIVSWLVSKLLLRTPFCLLPNIVAEREVVPEFVPWPFGAGPIVAAANHLLLDSKNIAIQKEELARIRHRFANREPDKESARAIIRLLTAKGGAESA